MKFKDVAHFHVGCKVKSDWSGIIYTLSVTVLANVDYWNVGTKPILYPLSVMTKEQKNYIGYSSYIMGDYSPNSFKYLLSHHFDLFNLIESGEAIDVTTLEKDPYKEEQK